MVRAAGAVVRDAAGADRTCAVYNEEATGCLDRAIVRGNLAVELIFVKEVRAVLAHDGVGQKPSTA
ncbi:hypothetical protein QE361_001142 [Sphingomonas sp. SORGH_AS802]|nr:hypothetical protein [Sphingomonas sp. SORGH_AS_0438]MDR6134167.1 hypothetical protein [Sphingomonas sp. SORGH_AS_0802]